MVEITTETENALVDLAENNDVEKDVVVEKFKEKYKEVKERADNVDEDYLEKLALRATRTAELASNRVPTDAVQMLTIGGSIRNWSNGDTFVGKALVDLEPNTDDGKTFLSTTIIDEGDENLGKIQEAFAEVGNIVTGQFSVSEAHTDQFRVLNSSEDTEIEFEKPDDRAPMIQEIRDAVPETDIESITENMTQTERDEETGNLYPASFGVDVRRMTVDIYDGYKNPEEGNGTYTVRDDTVFDEEDIADSSVFDQEEAGENATPGLTAWTEPSMMEYASGSVVEMIGTVTKNDDGIVAMNVDGIIPILDEGEYDGYTDESSETQAPERGESSGNVDRTTI
jgi:nitrogen regulatory protein PII-like uncharacterized protein